MNKVYRTKTLKRIAKKIQYLGYNPKNISRVLNIRLFTSLIIFLFFLILPYGIILSFIASIIYYITFESWYLDYRIKKRKKILEEDAIYFFEVLVLLLENNDLYKALEITAFNIDNELSLEFKKVLSEIKLGKNLKESFNNLTLRIPSQTIREMIFSLSSNYELGTNYIPNLNNHLAYLREKKNLNLKSQILKIPLKIKLAALFLMGPVLLLIIFGPIILNMVQ